MAFDYDRFDVLTFDTYGTLIDWEAGIMAAFHQALPELAEVDPDELLERYGQHEAWIEAGPYLRYRDVLAAGAQAVATDYGAEISDDKLASFSESVRDWPPFPDSGDALRRLQTRFALAVITNCDTDLFAASSARLGVEFDYVVTAEMARSYKPSHTNFDAAFRVIGKPRERILHVAQSLFHDHVPAKELGLSTVWIDRRHDRDGSGATPTASAQPDLRFTSMAAFAADAVPRSR
jgi:2-haloacid dehalogenase